MQAPTGRTGAFSGKGTALFGLGTADIGLGAPVWTHVPVFGLAAQVSWNRPLPLRDTRTRIGRRQSTPRGCERHVVNAVGQLSRFAMKAGRRTPTPAEGLSRCGAQMRKFRGAQIGRDESNSQITGWPSTSRGACLVSSCGVGRQVPRGPGIRRGGFRWASRPEPPARRSNSAASRDPPFRASDGQTLRDCCAFRIETVQRKRVCRAADGAGLGVIGSPVARRTRRHALSRTIRNLRD